MSKLGVPGPATTKAEKVVEVEAGTLAREYTEDKDLADSRYKGAIDVVVSGQVKEVVVALLTGEVFLRIKAPPLVVGITCFFDDEDQVRAIRRLHEGQAVKVKGRVWDKNLASVVLAGCKLVDR
jgi:hypothetical protein